MSSTLVQLGVLVVTPGVAGLLVALPIVLRVKPRPVRIPNYVVPLPPKHIAAHQASRPSYMAEVSQ